MLRYQMNVQSINDISWIIEAAQETMNATEKDFEAIRAKKWYKRLWETVTFSKDNQIKIARGVSSLSKLQEIMIRLLVVLSQNSAEISNAVKQNSDLINKLAITDTLLFRQIDKIKFGGTSQIDFSDLSREKKVLIASLLIMADPTVQRNEYSKQYISSVLRVANITSFDNTVKIDAVDCLGREEQELLYRMIMIDRYLMGIDFEEPSDIIDEISVKPIRKKEIRASILDTACAVSPEFFATYYEKTIEILDEVSDEGIWFVDFEGTTEADEVEDTIEPVDPSKYGDMILSSILHIPQGETYRFENNNIHVQTMIHCEGNLVFQNCTIHYGENGIIGKIIIKSTGSISMANCKVEGYSAYEKTQFITMESGGEPAKFFNCTFINCCSFVDSSDVALQFQDCTIKNAGAEFITGRSHIIINKTRFIFERLHESVKATLASTQSAVISAIDVIFSESNILGYPKIEHAKETGVPVLNHWFVNSRNYLISSDRIIANHAHFKESCTILYAPSCEITNSTFENCIDIIKSTAHGNDLIISDCTFKKCTEVCNSIGGAKIRHCKFYECYNTVIGNSGPGVEVEYCEFIDWNVDEDDSSSKAMIELKRFKGRNHSIIKNCIFNGISARKYFVVKGDIFEKIDGMVAYIENCTFENCTTERDSGKLIKEYGGYWNIFKKYVEVKTIAVASSCQGLDRVKKAAANH